MLKLSLWYIAAFFNALDQMAISLVISTFGAAAHTKRTSCGAKPFGLQS